VKVIQPRDKVVQQFDCFKFPIWDDYAKLQNSLKSLPYLIDRVIVEQSQLRDEFNKLKFDLIGLCGLLPEYHIVISDSDDDEIYRKIKDYYSDDGDDA